MAKEVQAVERQAVSIPYGTAVPSEQVQDAFLAMIERAARDPAVDIDKFERLIAIRERQESRLREDAFNEAMAKVQAEIKPIIKDSENEHTHSEYASLEAILEKITPIYTAHGFSLSFTPELSEKDGYHKTVCLVSCAGHTRRYEADLPADLVGSKGNVNKNPIQGFGSTMTYGRRYLTCLIFNVPIKGQDDDGQSVYERISDEQLMEIRETIEAIAEAQGSDLAASIGKFCALFKVKTLADIAADQYEEARRILEETPRTRRERK